MPATVLIVDDEANILLTLGTMLELAGYAVEKAGGARVALEKVSERPIDLVLLDVKLQKENDGLEVLKQLHAARPDLPVLMISAHGTIEIAVQAVRMGAVTFLEKPLERDRVLVEVQRALREEALVAELQELRPTYAMIGASPPMRTLTELIRRAAPSEARVLITGENGTGKELVARAIHDGSRRRAGPFVKMNCAAVPSELIESELFGHEKGAFTGAVTTRRGKFEVAHGGTLFLDEVGDAPASLQAKLLRVLQEGEFERVGGTETLRVDVRVIAASNKDLAREIAAGRFREDLYYRLNVMPIRSPALRERKDDIPALAESFLAEASRRNGRRPMSLASAAAAALQGYEYPGNVRELRNLVERLAILCDGPEVGPDDVLRVLPGAARELPPPPPPEVVPPPRPEAPPAAPASGTGAPQFDDSSILEMSKHGEGGTGPLRDRIAQAEREIILATLDRCGGNVAETARALDLERSHLYKKMRALGIKPRD